MSLSPVTYSTTQFSPRTTTTLKRTLGTGGEEEGDSYQHTSYQDLHITKGIVSESLGGYQNVSKGALKSTRSPDTNSII